MTEGPGTADRRDDALRGIREIVGPSGWTDDPGDMAPYLADRRGLSVGRAAMVVRPADTAEVSAVVELCAAHDIAIVPQGGNTSLVGASVPTGAGPSGTGLTIILALGRMNRIRATDPDNDTITVEAGCILADIQAAASAVDRLFPLSLAAEGSCQIGGNIATNAGGTAVLRYGTMRSLVLGLEAVLPDGRVWNGLRGLRKDNTGYDLKQMLIGAEGTLGVVTAAVLKLFPKPRDVRTVFAAVRDPEAAVQLLGRLRSAAGDCVTSFEILPRIGLEMVLAYSPGASDPLEAAHDWYLLIELSGQRADETLRAVLEEVLAQALEDGLVPDAAIAETLAQAAGFWRLREDLSDAQKIAGGSIKHDVSVPVSAVPDFLSKASAAVRDALPGVRVVAFGHVGDGNIHFNLTQPEGADRDAFLGEWTRMNRIVHDMAIAMGGSFSAEHGVGRMKVEELRRYREPVELDAMRAIKKALDPRGIMNPGVLF